MLTKHQKSFITIIVLLVILKLTLLIVTTLFLQTINYKAIFTNEVSVYNNRIKFNNNEILYSKNSNYLKKFNKIGFLADDATIASSSGIAVYKFAFKDHIFGTVGVRELNSHNNSELIAIEEKYYKKLLYKKYNIVAKNIKLIKDDHHDNQLAQIFFLDHNNFLWNYNIDSNSVLLLNSDPNNIDYIVSIDLFKIEAYNKTKPYIIYLYSQYKSLHNTVYGNIISIINVNLENRTKKILLQLKLDQLIANFKLYYNYLMIFFEDLNLLPVTYKIVNDVNNSINLERINNINYTLINSYKKSCSSFDRIKFILSWDPKMQLHQAHGFKSNCEIVSYNFSLPTDCSILSFTTIDY